MTMIQKKESQEEPGRIDCSQRPFGSKAQTLPRGDLPPVRRRRASLWTFWLKVHLYLGLFVGPVLVLIGLTGSLLVFYQAIDELLNPGLLTTQGTGAVRPLDEIVAAAQARHPEKKGPYSLVLPRHAQGTLIAWYEIPTGRAGTSEWLQVLIDPYTANVLGERFWGQCLISVIYKLHYTLLLKSAGEVTVGVLGLFLLLSIGTGIYIWWPLFWPPRWGRLRQAFGIKRGAPPVRFHFDLHKTSGIYSALILLVIAFSGVYMIFPEYIKPIVGFFSPVTQEPEPKSIHWPGAAPISVDLAVAIADRVFPDAELKEVALSEGPEGVYIVTKRQPQEVRKSWGESQVWIGLYTGEVLAIRDPKKNTGGDTFLGWQFPLHNGEALGLPGRIVVFISGFVPLILYVTGLQLWLKRRRSKKISWERRGERSEMGAGLAIPK